MKAHALLRTDDLAVGHAGRILLAGIGLQLAPGSLTALVGINGIGKSTLLRTLAGLHPPLAGKVIVRGHDLHGLSASTRAREVAVVLTGRSVAAVIDVETLVGLGRQPWTDRWGRLNEEDRRMVDRALELAGATSLRNRSLATCSDGECQKALIARALAQATPVLLLDEPTAYLDLPSRASIVRVLRTISREEGKAVLFSTHDIQMVLDLCDHVLLMRQDQAMWQGSPHEALASGVLAKAFAGSGVRFDAASGTHRFIP